MCTRACVVSCYYSLLLVWGLWCCFDYGDAMCLGFLVSKRKHRHVEAGEVRRSGQSHSKGALSKRMNAGVKCIEKTGGNAHQTQNAQRGVQHASAVINRSITQIKSFNANTQQQQYNSSTYRCHVVVHNERTHAWIGPRARRTNVLFTTVCYRFD